ncbi:ribonuclease HII [Patescibacteria group bacterium]|nr:ribonuclease HII [Patescibacteria group bacterium]
MTRFSEMLIWERKLWNMGVRLIAGIDEVGKGPLAGPVVASAVILDLRKVFEFEEQYNNSTLDETNSTETKEPNTHDKLKDTLYIEINDSKKISDKKRRLISDFLQSRVLDYAIAEISHEFIDKHGISTAVQLAFYQSIKGLDIKPEHVLTDFVHIRKITEQHQTNIIQGDSLSLTIAAASIIAKVHRDNIMIDMHNIYPQYQFHQHKGYGTKKHIQALREYGPCKIHRRSFEPVKTYSRYF